MLSQLKFKLHDILVGAANLVAPSKVENTAANNNDLSIEDLIRYPPETKGIPVIGLENIIASQSEILRLMHRDSGLIDPKEDEVKAKKKKVKGKVKPLKHELNFDTLFRQVIVNYIQYVHLLPASENHHHADVGGLARHSLEVALNSFRKSQHQVLPAIGQLDEEQARKPRWQYAAWVCGLLHDAGKVLYDMRVYDVDTGKDWNPYLANLIQWATDNNVKRYRVVWRPEHRHKKHENLSVTVLEWVLTPEAKGYLMDNSDELPIAINHALAHYGNSEGYLQSCVRAADSASTEKDIQTQWHEMIGKRRYPLESAIVKAMRRLRDNWLVNQPKGHVWIIGNDVYLSWPKAIQLIVQRLQDDKVDVPVNPSRILEILEERNLVKRLDESVTYSMFTPTDMEGVTGPERVICLSWPGLLYETMPVPRSVGGVLRLNNDGKSVEYFADGSMKEIEADGTDNEILQVNDKPTVTKSAESKKQPKAIKKSSSKKEAKKSSSSKPEAVSLANEKDIKQKQIKEEVSPPPKINKSTQGLSFANQGEGKALVTNTPRANEPEHKSEADTGNIKNKHHETSVIEKTVQVEQADFELDSLQVPSYLSDDDEVPSQVSNVENNKLKESVQEQAQKANRKEKPASSKHKANSPISSMLKQRKVSMSQEESSALKPKWWEKDESKLSVGDILLVRISNGLAKGSLSLTSGKEVFIKDECLFIESGAIQEIFKLDVSEVTEDLKRNRRLLYDKLKPNLLVKRVRFGKGWFMCIALVKATTNELLTDLNISARIFDYENNPEPESNPASKSTTSKIIRKDESAVNEHAADVQSLLDYIFKLGNSGTSDYVQKLSDNKHWAIYLKGLISDYLNGNNEKGREVQLKKSITELAVSSADMNTPSGNKYKHLIIEQNIIG